MTSSDRLISPDSLQISGEYERPKLAALWGYKSHAAISRGIITPTDSGLIILFVTKDKQKSETQYEDSFDGRILPMEGETSGANDERLITSATSGERVHLFYRSRHHQPFIYCGEVRLLRYEKRDDGPTRFVFEVRGDAVPLGD
jgi:5-methylcytosine-specific restriction protein A